MSLTVHMLGPLLKLKELISELPTAQSLTGIITPFEALPFIHSGYAEKIDGELPAQAKKPLPHFIVSLEDFDRTRSTTGGFETTIYFQWFIEVKTPEAISQLSKGGRYEWWLAQCEKLSDELSLLVAPQDRLLINDIASSIIPQARPVDDQEDQGETWIAAFLLEVQS